MDSQEITIEMMRENLYAAVVSDALDALGYKNQSPVCLCYLRRLKEYLLGAVKQLNGRISISKIHPRMNWNYRRLMLVSQMMC